MKTTLSVVVITHDEEKNIRRCLGSVRAARLSNVRVVEVLVVDSQSADGTTAAARSLGAKVMVRPWPGYSAQKNWAFQRCRGAWVLSLDADEEMTPELWAEIDGVLADPRADAYAVPRKAFFLGGWMRHGGWWPDRQVRLLRKGKGSFEGAIHEGIRVDGTTGDLSNPMLHHSYPTLADYFRKMEEYSSVTAAHAPPVKRLLWPAYLVVRPPLTFLKMAVLKLGFLDWWRGLLLAGLSAWHEVLKYWKIGSSRSGVLAVHKSHESNRSHGTHGTYERLLPRNLVVRVPNWLGDTLMATPAVLRLRRILPRARITVLCKPAFVSFWRSFPGVDAVMAMGPFLKTVREVREKSFDAAIILPTSFSSALMMRLAGVPQRVGYGSEGRDLLLTRAVENETPRARHLVAEYLNLLERGIGSQGAGSGPVALHAPVTAEGRREAARLLREARVRRGAGIVALAPGAVFGPAKRWPAEHWREFAARLLDSGKEDLIVVGEEREARDLSRVMEGLPPDRVHLLAGKTPLPVLAAVLAGCRVLVTNDTGPMHVAAGVGTPVVAVFGSTSPVWTRPFGAGNRVVRYPVPCSPCFQRRCNIGYPCLVNVTPAAVLAETRDVLRRGVRVRPEPVPDRG